MDFVTELAAVKIFVEKNFGKKDKHNHDDDASDEPREKEAGGVGAVFIRESRKKCGWHENRKQEINDLAVGFGADKFFATKKKAQGEDECNGAKTGVKCSEIDIHMIILTYYGIMCLWIRTQ